MIDVHFAIDYFDGTLSQLWDEAAIEAHLDELVTLDDLVEGAVVIGEAEILDALFSAVQLHEAAAARPKPGHEQLYRSDLSVAKRTWEWSAHCHTPMVAVARAIGRLDRRAHRARLGPGQPRRPARRPGRRDPQARARRQPRQPGLQGARQADLLPPGRSRRRGRLRRGDRGHGAQRADPRWPRGDARLRREAPRGLRADRGADRGVDRGAGPVAPPPHPPAPGSPPRLSSSVHTLFVGPSLALRSS